MIYITKQTVKSLNYAKHSKHGTTQLRTT